MLNTIKKAVPPITLLLILTLIFVGVPVFSAEQDETTEEIFYYLHDHLGGIEAVLDEDGEVVERRDYLPFGKTREEVIANTEHPELYEDYGYTGKELDDETGLYYYGARYYDSEIGRFTQIDPLVLGESEKPLASVLENPQALNSYSYVTNNPLKYVDPSGEWSVFAHALFTIKAINSSSANDDWKKEHDQSISWGASWYADVIDKRDPSYHSTTPNDVTNATELKAKIINNAKGLFMSKDDDDKFGKLLHMIQDTYCPSHTKRNKDGKITEFYDFDKQNKSKHIFIGDSIKNADFDVLTGAMDATKKLIEFRLDENTKWSDIEDYLDKEVLILSNDAKIGKAGKEYEKD